MAGKASMPEPLRFWVPQMTGREQEPGVGQRHTAADDECASDLGIRAAELSFAPGACARGPDALKEIR